VIIAVWEAREIETQLLDRFAVPARGSVAVDSDHKQVSRSVAELSCHCLRLLGQSRVLRWVDAVLAEAALAVQLTGDLVDESERHVCGARPAFSVNDWHVGKVKRWVVNGAHGLPSQVARHILLLSTACAGLAKSVDAYRARPA